MSAHRTHRALSQGAPDSSRQGRNRKAPDPLFGAASKFGLKVSASSAPTGNAIIAIRPKLAQPGAGKATFEAEYHGDWYPATVVEENKAAHKVKIGHFLAICMVDTGKIFSGLRGYGFTIGCRRGYHFAIARVLAESFL